MEKLVLLDGNSLANRAFWAIPALNDAEGNPTNAVFGFVNMLLRIIENERPSHIAAAFDLPEPTFRHKKYAGYKATRKPMPEELQSQMPKIKELLRLMGISVFELSGYEADDIIGTMAKKSGVPTVIFTGDRDELQLVDERVTVHMTKRGITETEIFDPAHIKEVYGFGPEHILDYKALMGDASDNIPGVPGVGEKTAAALVAAHGGLDDIYAAAVPGGAIAAKPAEKLNVGKDSAYLSYDLATIDTEVPVAFAMQELDYTFPFPAPVKTRFSEYGFSSLLKRRIFADGDWEKSGAEDPGADKETPVSDEAASPAPEKTYVPRNAYASRRVFTGPPPLKDGQSEIVTIKTADELSAVRFRSPVTFVFSDAHLSFAFDEKKEYRVVYGEQTLFEPALDFYGAADALKSVFEDGNTEKILFDKKSVKTRLQKAGIGLEGELSDVQLMQYCADCTLPLSAPEKLLAARKLAKLSETPAAGLFVLFDALKKEIEPVKSVYYDIEKPLSDVLFEMERYGFKIDTAEMDKLGREFSERLSALSEEIFSAAGARFNINSPKQLSEILFDRLKLSPKGKTKTKQLSTDAEVLEGLADAHPVIPPLLKFRTLSKLNGTYIEGLRKLLTPEGVLHTEFKQTVTSTGRLSSVEPNLQNIPVRDDEGRKIRKFFVSRPGRLLVSADYSQIELRMLAHCSGCAALQKAYERDEDIHVRTAAEVFGVAPADVTKEMRRRAKTINFGIIYGMSDFGLAKELSITGKEAHEYKTRYFAAFPEIKDYLDGLIIKARETGMVETMFGRVRRIPDITHPNFQVRSFSERAAMNMPLQGAAADLIKLAMLRVHAALEEEKIDAHLLCQVHDELILESSVEDAERARDTLRREMESAAVLSVPLRADAEIADNWYAL